MCHISWGFSTGISFACDDQRKTLVVSEWPLRMASEGRLTEMGIKPVDEI